MSNTVCLIIHNRRYEQADVAQDFSLHKRRSRCNRRSHVCLEEADNVGRCECAEIPCEQEIHTYREKVTFTWDWHAWNLAIACTPGLLLWAYLHHKEKQVLEEARIRHAVQEITGVSSRGYMVPTQKARDEARDMLRKGNTSGRKVLEAAAAADEENGGAAAIARVTSEAQRTGANGRQDTETLLQVLSYQKLLQKRLITVEKQLGLESPTVPEEISPPHRIEQAEGALRSDDDLPSPQGILRSDEDDSSTLEKAGKAVSKALEVASEVRTWVVNVGVPEGIRLYCMAREWLTKDDEDVYDKRDIIVAENIWGDLVEMVDAKNDEPRETGLPVTNVAGTGQEKRVGGRSGGNSGQGIVAVTDVADEEGAALRSGQGVGRVESGKDVHR